MVAARSTLALAAAALCFAAQAIDAAVINTSVKRVLDLTKHVVRVQTDIHFVDAEQDTTEYIVAFPAAKAARLAHVAAKCGKAACNVVPTAHTAAPADVTQYTVVLSDNSVAKGDVGHIKLTAFFTRVLTPFPAQVTQKDEQLVVYEDAHVLLSPYATQTQTTKVKLPTSRVESFSPIEPVSRKGSAITYGPYVDTAPFTGAADASSLRVHYKNHAPFLTVTSLVRELEVSMWGRVSVEEVVDAEHTGARLTGGFSRFDYMMQHERGASFHDLSMALPADAVNVYYRDQIGNVSTSRLRPTATRQELAFQPRFPLFGGWKTQWYIGYSVPTHSVLTRNGDSFTFTIDFSTSLDGAAVDDLIVKVILPEGSTNVRVHVPFAVDSVADTTRQTYLDTPLVGRPVVVISKQNVVAAHNVPFTVTFDFPQTFMLHEPLLLVGAFFAFFLVCIGLFRLDVSLLTRKTAVPVVVTKPKTQ